MAAHEIDLPPLQSQLARRRGIPQFVGNEIIIIINSRALTSHFSPPKTVGVVLFELELVNRVEIFRRHPLIRRVSSSKISLRFTTRSSNRTVPTAAEIYCQITAAVPINSKVVISGASAHHDV